jgi:hypothetical protein
VLCLVCTDQTSRQSELGGLRRDPPGHDFSEALQRYGRLANRVFPLPRDGDHGEGGFQERLWSLEELSARILLDHFGYSFDLIELPAASFASVEVRLNGAVLLLRKQVFFEGEQSCVWDATVHGEISFIVIRGQQEPGNELRKVEVRGVYFDTIIWQVFEKKQI